MLETGNAQIWWLQRVVNLWEVSWSYPLVVDLPYDDQPVNLKQGYSGMGAWELDKVGENPMTWNH